MSVITVYIFFLSSHTLLVTIPPNRHREPHIFLGKRSVIASLAFSFGVAIPFLKREIATGYEKATLAMTKKRKRRRLPVFLGVMRG